MQPSSMKYPKLAKNKIIEHKHLKDKIQFLSRQVLQYKINHKLYGTSFGRKKKQVFLITSWTKVTCCHKGII